MKLTIDDFRPERVRSKRGLGQRRLEQIEAAMPKVPITKRADLWNGLNTTFYWYWWARKWRNVPPVSEIRGRLRSVASAGRRLLHHLGLGEEPRPFGETMHDLPYLLIATLDPAVSRHAKRIGGYPDLPPRPFDKPSPTWGDTDYRSFEKLNNVVEGVQLMIKWADDAVIAWMPERISTACADVGAGLEPVTTRRWMARFSASAACTRRQPAERQGCLAL